MVHTLARMIYDKTDFGLVLNWRSILSSIHIHHVRSFDLDGFFLFSDEVYKLLVISIWLKIWWDISGKLLEAKNHRAAGFLNQWNS